MALDATRLATAIKTRLLLPPIGAIDGESLDAFCEAIAEAVITEIKTNAELVIDIGPPAGGTIE